MAASLFAPFLHVFMDAVHLLSQAARHFALASGACFACGNSNPHVSSNRANPIFKEPPVQITFPRFVKRFSDSTFQPVYNTLASRPAGKSRFLNFQQTTPCLARVPPDWQVCYVDEEAEEIDWTIHPDKQSDV
jgi:hypothetical protein